MGRAARSLIGLGVFFASWEVAARTGTVPPAFLPPPGVVLWRLLELLGQKDFQRDMIAGGLAWAIALVIAVAVAAPAGPVLGGGPLARPVRWSSCCGRPRRSP